MVGKKEGGSCGSQTRDPEDKSRRVPRSCT
jgi:hypothetical protein